MGVKRGIFLAPFDELVDPRLLGELARQAEGRGWDGFFLWDHVAYRLPVRAVADPWIALAAVAGVTETLRLGPMVTPLSRRRVHELARETATLDHLSVGRLTLGVGLAVIATASSSRSGKSPTRGSARACSTRAWSGWRRYGAGSSSRVQRKRPRIPVWVAARWPNRRPLQRAARWDGLFPIELPGPEALAVLADEVGRRARRRLDRSRS